MSTIFVTGATGFIGGHLTRALVDAGHHVRCLVRKSSSVDDAALAARSSAWKLSCWIATALAGAVQGTDCVFHLAGLTSALRRATLREINEHGCANVARGMCCPVAAAGAGARLVRGRCGPDAARAGTDRRHAAQSDLELWPQQAGGRGGCRTLRTSGSHHGRPSGHRVRAGRPGDVADVPQRRPHAAARRGGLAARHACRSSMWPIWWICWAARRNTVGASRRRGRDGDGTRGTTSPAAASTPTTSSSDACCTQAVGNRYTLVPALSRTVAVADRRRGRAAGSMRGKSHAV